jgi:hypothetical protein
MGVAGADKSTKSTRKLISDAEPPQRALAARRELATDLLREARPTINLDTRLAVARILTGI